MDRKSTTKFLSDLLEKDKFGGISKYWAKEVTFDYGKYELTNTGYQSKSKRVDYMEFCPENQISISGIEKGIFICYEIKSCKSDFLSGHGQNFIGEKNYLVTTMSTYKELKECGEIDKLPHYIGIMVPIPNNKKYNKDKIQSEYENPTEIHDINNWHYEVIRNAKKTNRQKSMNELLFCMLRSLVNHN